MFFSAPRFPPGTHTARLCQMIRHGSNVSLLDSYKPLLLINCSVITFGIIGALPHILKLLEEVRDATGGLSKASKTSSRDLRNHRRSLNNLLHEVDERTRTYAGHIPQELFSVIRSLGVYSKQLCDEIDEFRELYGKPWVFKAIRWIAGMPISSKSIPMYRDQLRDVT